MDITANEIDLAHQLEYQKLTNILAQRYTNPTEENIDELIAQIKILEKFSISNNKLYVLFSHPKFYPLYISENLKYVGYNPKEILQLSLLEAFKLVYWKQVFMSVKVHKWGGRFRQIFNGPTSLNHEAFFCGIKFYDKWRQLHTVFIKQKFLSIGKNGEPLLSFLEIEVIDNLFKGNFCWARMIAPKNDYLVTRAFFTKGSKKEYPDLLTNRELGILKLIIDKKDTETIANQLEISPETVKKHRKNMIARVGAKDMTSLIHLCHLCNLVPSL